MNNSCKIILSLIIVLHIHTYSFGMQLFASRMCVASMVKKIPPTQLQNHKRSFHSNIARYNDVNTSPTFSPCLLEFQHAVNQQLLEREQLLKQHLAKEHGISETSCTQLLDSMVEVFSKDTRSQRAFLPADKEIEKKVSTLLQDLTVPADTIQIQRPTKEDRDPMFSTAESIIAVNPAFFNKFSLDTQKFITAHEFGHILHQDGYYMYVTHLLTKNRKLRQAIAHLMESRADLYALTRGVSYAQGGICFFTALNHPRTDEHPCSELRLRQAEGIHTALIQLKDVCV